MYKGIFFLNGGKRGLGLKKNRLYTKVVTHFDFWVQGFALQNLLNFLVIARSAITKKLLFYQK